MGQNDIVYSVMSPIIIIIIILNKPVTEYIWPLFQCMASAKFEENIRDKTVIKKKWDDREAKNDTYICRLLAPLCIFLSCRCSFGSTVCMLSTCALHTYTEWFYCVTLDKKNLLCHWQKKNNTPLDSKRDYRFVIFVWMNVLHNIKPLCVHLSVFLSPFSTVTPTLAESNTIAYIILWQTKLQRKRGTMSTKVAGYDDTVICPYEKCHVIRRERIQFHLVKCARAHPDIILEKCPFDVTHRIRVEEMAVSRELIGDFACDCI